MYMGSRVGTSGLEDQELHTASGRCHQWPQSKAVMTSPMWVRCVVRIRSAATGCYHSAATVSAAHRSSTVRHSVLVADLAAAVIERYHCGRRHGVHDHPPPYVDSLPPSSLPSTLCGSP